jgi:hypothetical protein
LAATHDHVFVALGHISDFSLPIPPGQVVLSSCFNQGFLINDDNHLPYQQLWTPGHGNPGPADSKLNVGDLESFIAPLPEKVFLAAEQQQEVVTKLLAHSVFGIRAKSHQLTAKPLVTRSFLRSGSSFKRHLLTRGMGHADVENAYRALPLPRFIWVTEFSNPSLFPNQILGEIIWDATRNVHETDGWIAIHYPEFLALDVGSCLNRLPNIIKNTLDKGGAYAPYQSNLEWIK